MFWVIDKENLSDASNKFVQNNKGELLYVYNKMVINNVSSLKEYVGITTDLCYTDLYYKLSSNNIPFGMSADIDDSEICIPCLNITFVFDIDGGSFKFTH